MREIGTEEQGEEEKNKTRKKRKETQKQKMKKKADGQGEVRDAATVVTQRRRATLFPTADTREQHLY
jgi:hypothetical protein